MIAGISSSIHLNLILSSRIVRHSKLTAACAGKPSFLAHRSTQTVEKSKKSSETMAFGDVKTPKGLQELNSFLADNSYIAG